MMIKTAETKNSTLTLGLKLMNVLLSGKFCPHAKGGIGYDELKTISPLFVKLFIVLIEPSVHDAKLVDMVLENMTALLRLLLEYDVLSSNVIFEELVDVITNVSLNCPSFHTKQ